MINDILVGMDEVRDYMVQFKADAKQLKEAMSDIGVLLAKSTMGKVFEVSYDGEHFRLNASTSIKHLSNIGIIDTPPDTEFSIVCLYEDITDLIPGTGEVTISLSQQHFTIITKTGVISLRISIADVESIPPIVGQEVTLNQNILLQGIKKLTSLTAISNVFKSNNIISMKHDIMQVKFPTVWVEVGSSVFDMNLSRDVATVVMNFINSPKPIKVIQNNTYVILVRNNSYLFVPASERGSVTPVSELLREYTYSGVINFEGAMSKLKNLLKAAGKSDATIQLHEEGWRISINTNALESVIDIGTIVGPPVDRFTIRLEFLVNLLPILGGTCDIYKKHNLRCFTNSYAKVIVTSM